MKIVVTGCAGFIGANFSEYILDNYSSDIVVGIDCLTYAASEKALSCLNGYKNFIFYRADICDKTEMERIFDIESPDAVVNFAAESHVDRSFIDPDIFMRTNVHGTGVLLEVANKYKVKHFHQISTDEVYGDMPLDAVDRFTESSRLTPNSPYSVSKATADMLVLDFSEKQGVSASISRSTNNYGKYQHTEKLIPMAINRILSDQSVTLYGDGSNMRDWLYVLDHCRAVDMIIRAGKRGIFNVGAANEWANIDLVKKIMSLLGKPDGEIAFVEDRKNHDRRYPVCCEKIMRELDWRPEADFEVKLKETVEWYKGRK